MIHKAAGFSLLELFITFSVIILLGAIAVPAYQDYIRRTYFADVVLAANSYKAAVNECYKKTKKLSECNSGFHAVPSSIVIPKGSLKSLVVEKGVIQVVPVSGKGVLATDSYILTPTPSTNGTLTWIVSGDAVKKGYAEK